MEQQAIARMNGGLQGQGHMMQGGGGNVMSTPTSAQRPGILNSMSPAPNQQISRPRKILFGLHEFFFFSSVALKVCNFFFFLCLLLFLQLTRY